MSKKIAADHIKLKRAYEPPAPDERTGLRFRESEVKAYDDALKSCGWPPHHPSRIPAPERAAFSRFIFETRFLFP